MPIYEYTCGACGHQFETLQKFSDEPLVDCDSCGEAALKKLVSAAAFHLKGTGWYATDFKKGRNGFSGTADEAESSSESSDTSDTEDKKSAASDSESTSSDNDAKATSNESNNSVQAST